MITLNDPRITAYLLGELDPEEVEVIEQALRSSPTLAKNVEQMRQTIELLKIALPEESLDYSSQTSEQKSDSVSKNSFQDFFYKTNNRWLKFLWKTSIVLIVGLGLYFLSLPKAPIQKSDNASSSHLLSQRTEDDESDSQISFDPMDPEPTQSSVDKTLEQYGLTPKQIEQLNQQPEESNSDEFDVVALFPLEAVNQAERFEKRQELHDSDGWQYNTYKPKNAATGLGSNLSDKLFIENPVEYVSDKPKSSFGLVPKSVSWNIFQHSIKDSQKIPSSQTVRVDQYVNHFRYSLPKPQTDGAAFSISVQIGAHPWASGMLLAVVGVRSQDGSEGDTAAKDASIEIVFNPERVKAYRLLGYEKRLTTEDSTPYAPLESDQVPANSEVVALYELVLTDDSSTSEVKPDSNLFTASITYCKPDSSDPLTETLNVKTPTPEILEQTSQNPDFRFAAGVALFAQILQKSEYSGTGSLDTVLQLIQDSVGDNPQRKEFADLARQVKEAFVKQSRGLKSDHSQSETKP